MIKKLFQWFENAQTSFPDELPNKPPNTLLGFVSYYAKPFWPFILASALLSTVIALIEVYLFSFLGSLVDWLAIANRETFWQDHSSKLIQISVLILIGIPTLKFVYEIIINQGMLGNFAMRTRWQSHRYLLRQSVGFFQDDFAGRVAAKMMQTSLGVRDSVIKIAEVLIYVSVYFTGAVILFASSDVRLIAPMILWLFSYIAILRYFIPKLRQVSMEQAEARSMVTGRVVDSYTNITTVKMFAHTQYEDDYAKEGMSAFLVNVYRQMRLSTQLSATLTVMNSILLFSVSALSIVLWQAEAISTGAIAFAVGLVLRLQGMSQWILWEVSSLFENLGVVQDGIETISQDIAISDQKAAKPLHVTKGQIEYKNIVF